MAGAGIGGGIGQHLRGRLIGAGFNQNGVTALVAVAACGLYALIAAIAMRLGLGDGTHAAGFISSILFLVPGFPLVAALLDVLQYQAAAALTRFAYAMTIVLAAAFGMSIVVALVGFDLAAQPPFAIAPAAKLLFRALASFVGGAAFAMLFNNPPRVALVIGLLALAANLLRLELNDAGMMLAPATFLGVLAVGLLASLTRRRLGVPLITITVPAIIVMVPGVYAFQAIVLFNQARMIEALQAASSCAFVTGAMAAGLATARFLSERWSSAER
jgi:uncharacterized membrane protein YjjB (DUF3815 family)